MPAPPSCAGWTPAVGLSPCRPAPQGKQLRALQPYVLNCCYSADSGIVAETLQVLRGLVEQLSWQHAAPFLIQLAFTLGPFLEVVSPLRARLPSGVSGK